MFVHTAPKSGMKTYEIQGDSLLRSKLCSIAPAQKLSRNQRIMCEFWYKLSCNKGTCFQLLLGEIRKRMKEVRKVEFVFADTFMINVFGEPMFQTKINPHFSQN